MADQDPISPGNGADQPNDGAQVAILAQYIKDLSVESPSAPQVFQWQGEKPQLEVQFNLNANRVTDEVHELELKLDASARSESGVHFLIDLTYAGLFGLRGVPEEALPPFLLVEAPRLLFPFARQIVAEATQNAGFPPLMLDPIDFGAIYMSQIQAGLQQQQQQNGGSAASEPSSDS